MSHDFPLIIADESVDFRFILHLRDNGYSVYSILTETPGITDKKVIEIAVEKKGYIITEDKDFGDELVYNQGEHIGTMLLRIQDMTIDMRIKLVVNTLDHHSGVLKDSFSVLTSKKLRSRKYL